MNRRRKGARRRGRILQTWSISQAEAAVPYIRSVVASLREHHLELQAGRLEVRRLAARPGRPDRSAILALQQAQDEADRALERAVEDAEELAELDVYCLDPAAGQALLPFVYDEKLAWYHFDLFDERKPLRFWRYETDPIDMRRPITVLQKGSPGTVRVR
jgi:hypothetical protein